MHGTQARFPVWKKIQLGRFASKLDLLNELRSPSRGYFFHLLTKEIDLALENAAFSVSSALTEVNLVKVTCEDLGLKDYCGYGDICCRAQELGLELCPCEVGPALRLQSGDRDNSDIGPEEQLTVAMRPTPVENRDPIIFVVRGYYELATDAGHPNTAFRIKRKLIFTSPFNSP